MLFISARVTFRPFKVIQVIDFATNRKRVLDFLLVRHNNLGHILHRFGDIAGFLCFWPRPYSTLILGCSQSTRSPTLGSTYLKLFSREIVFEVLPVPLFQPVWSRYVNVTDRQAERETDERTDRRHTVT